MDEAGAGMSVRVSFWAGRRGLAAAEDAALRQGIASLIDRVMEGGGGLQAFVAAWRWYPQDLTPYESALGLSGTGPMCGTTSWCGRWLRAIPNVALWLGPELRRHLTGPDVSGGHLASSPCGPGLRIDVLKDDPAVLSDLERQMEPLLPTIQAHDRFHEWYYRDRPAGAPPPI